MKWFKCIHSKYYDKYGKIYEDLEHYAYEMGKEWDTYIIMFEEMADIVDNYWTFLRDNLEDLKLYALMYRNVSLGFNSILDKAFFISRKEIIKGFKNKIYSPSASKRELLVRYYYKYDDLFEIYCKQQLGLIITTKKNHLPLTLECAQDIKKGQFGKGEGLCNLSDKDCSILLKNIDKLVDNRIEDDFTIDWDIYTETKDFIIKRILPFYYDGTEEYKNLIRDFAHDYYKRSITPFMNNDQYELGKGLLVLGNYQRLRDYIDSNDDIVALKKEQRKLERPKYELVRLKHPVRDLKSIISIDTSSFISDYNYTFPYPSDLCISFNEEDRRKQEEWKRREREERERIEREKELKKREEEERKLKERKEKERELQVLIDQNKGKLLSITQKINAKEEEIKNSLQKTYDNFVECLIIQFNSENDGFWRYLFDNQHNIKLLYGEHIKNKRKPYIKKFYTIIQNQNREWVEFKCFCIKRSYSFPISVESFSSREPFESEIEVFRKNKGLALKWRQYIGDLARKYKIEEEKRAEEERVKRAEEERKRQEAEEKRLEPYRFNVRNKHRRDDNISFRKADHIYIVDGTPLDSVTAFIENCFPEFNSEYHAKLKAKALGVTKETVLNMWDKKRRESREQGSVMHEKIESYYLGKAVSTDETFELFMIFANKITLKPYRTEWTVYDWRLKIAGTIDFVDYQNGEYIIYDWKRSDKLIAKNGLPIKNSLYGAKALAPINNLEDSPYYHYALQLSMYKYIVEKNYGITISKLRLGIFHPSYNKPYILEIPYLQNEIDTLIKLRSEVVF